MFELVSYTLSHKISESPEMMVFRGNRNSDKVPVAIKFHTDENPSAVALARLQHEYAILQELALPGVVKTYGTERYNNRLLLILEDVPGQPLNEVLSAGSLDLKSVLELAISIAGTLDAVHHAGVIHKDIKPHNIVVRLDTRTATLIDFGISSRLQNEGLRLPKPDTLSGTLAYLSPEQTGRMNRAIDYRTDLYSLGVTLYQMLTGTLPFQSKDLMELIHSHIARKPASVRQVKPEIPDIVSDIVMKLLAKAPEERYQSARGLKADLETCLSMLTTTGLVAPFPLGQRDQIGLFRIPQKLYGREVEIGQLMEAWQRVSDGRTELLLIKGYAGIGKSALVNEIHKGIAHRGGFYIASKFDQMNRNVPYAAIAHAFRELIRQLLSSSVESLAAWKTKLTKALGANGQLIVDLIPELALIIGPQQPVPVLPPTEAQNRFTMVFEAFLHLFATEEHSLVLFLDDLQWADPASLELLKIIYADPESSHFLLISAYRDNEVDEHHPMSLALDELAKMGASISTITLKPLDSNSILQLVADAVSSDPLTVAPLAELIKAKTHGNPFFATQFLRTLYEDKKITFDTESGTWKWSLEEIEKMDVADNVVDFMSGKIRLLSADAQEAIKIASCIGHEFQLSTLATVLQRSQWDTASALSESLSEGIIVPLDSEYRFFFHKQTDQQAGFTDLNFDVSYKFLHDRVQQAAYSLIDPTKSNEFQLRIGRLLKAQAGGMLSGDNLFEILNHLNLGVSLITDPQERGELAALNLAAGRRAKASRAYLAASEYLDKGVSLLAEGCWEQHYELTYGLHVELAESEYLNRRTDRAETLFSVLVSHARTKEEQIHIYQLRCDLHTALGKVAEAVDIATDGLALCGIVIPKGEEERQAAMGAELAEIEVNMAGREIKDLIDVPELTDAERLPPARLFTSLFVPSVLVSPTLSALIAVKMVNLSLKYGHSDGSAYGYASYGMILIMVMKKYKEANEFVELAIAMLNKNPKWGTADWKCKIFEMYVGNVRFFRRSYRTNMPWIEQVHQTGIESGDYAHISYNRCDLFVTRFAAGDELELVYDDCVKSLALMQRTKDGLSTPCLTVAKQCVAALTGRTKGPYTLNDDAFDDTGFTDQMESIGLTFVAAWYFVHKLEVLYLHEDHRGALELVKQGDRTVESAAFWYLIIEHPFYAVLTLAALYPTATPEEQESFKARIADYIAKVAVFAENAPENNRQKHLLALAEQARIEQRSSDAMVLYDEAIEAARENNCMRDEALANELAARFHLEHRHPKIGRVYMSDAHYGYERWGAKVKAKLIADRYPFVALRGTAFSLAGTVPTSGTWSNSTVSGRVGALLDTATVIRTAQAIASELVLTKVLRRLMKVVIENAGAERGTLFIAREGELMAEAMSSVDQDLITVRESLPLEKCTDVPQSIVQYVARAREAVVVSDATREERFARDSYVLAKQPKSILCIPLMQQGRLTGVLYLEHRGVADVFTPARVELLQVVSAQAAIALENALLYTNLQRANETLEAQVAQRTEELRKTLAELWSEMDLARKIQTVLLPGDMRIGDYEMAALMKPALEVGGDYYDMFHIGGKSWVFMGDVSGHGVSAGLIMMMVQTAVRALVLNLGSQPESLSPSRVLDMVNKSVCGNLEKIGKGQYMTMVALCIDGSTIHFAGAHLDILVYRKALKKVECIPTDGAWLGIFPDISQMLVDSKFEMEAGDIMLLFTDGVTESIGKNRQLLGLEKLQGLFLKAVESETSGQGVIQNILAQMSDYSIEHDDVTLMAIQYGAGRSA